MKLQPFFLSIYYHYFVDVTMDNWGKQFAKIKTTHEKKTNDFIVVLYDVEVGM